MNDKSNQQLTSLWKQEGISTLSCLAASRRAPSSPGDRIWADGDARLSWLRPSVSVSFGQ
jgi:hypothetical protein